MRVRCIAEEPSEEQRTRLGTNYLGPRQSYGLVRGREYLVYGLEFGDGLAWAQIATEYDQLVTVPLFLFEITVPTIPDFWQARLNNGDLLLWPPSFYADFYHDRLASGEDPEVLADFRHVRESLERLDALSSQRK